MALDEVDLEVLPAEIHAVVGENGAGKTTLMSILFGLLEPDSGEIRMQGQPISFSSSLDAINAGLGMVHQSFRLFPSLTVAENIVFRSEPQSWGCLDRRTAHLAVTELGKQYGLEVDPAARVEDLPVGVLQRVEILKALYRDAQILILDEPTAVLTPQERIRLFEVLSRLRSAGRTILFITHKLDEVMTLSDRVTVLRNGKTVATLTTTETNPEEITLAMTGRQVDFSRLAPPHQVEEPVLEVEKLWVESEQGIPAVREVSFSVRAGEILGIAGIAGNGQTELIEALVGLRPTQAGRAKLTGTDITVLSVAQRREQGLAYIPEDRYREGTSGLASVTENLMLGHHRLPELQRRGWFSRTAIKRLVRHLVDRFGIRTASTEQPAATLSGGNLQKVVVAREMSHRTPLLIAEQPTRGVDVGAIEFIHRQLLSARDSRAAVLLVSAELSEIFALSTRILVMFEGQIVAELTPPIDELEIGRYMTGVARVA